jgi:hypothetical protein
VDDSQGKPRHQAGGTHFWGHRCLIFLNLHGSALEDRRCCSVRVGMEGEAHVSWARQGDCGDKATDEEND